MHERPEVGRESGVHDAEWLIALDVTSGKASATTEAIIRLASRIEPEWLGPTRSETRVALNASTGAVSAAEIDWYDELALREHPIAPPAAERAKLLAKAWLDRPPDAESVRLLRRIRFANLPFDLDDVVDAFEMAAGRGGLKSMVLPAMA